VIVTITIVDRSAGCDLIIDVPSHRDYFARRVAPWAEIHVDRCPDGTARGLLTYAVGILLGALADAADDAT
jgi:hypothetical protein